MTRLAWLLAFGSGFLSLSEEILWVRLVGFIHEGVPQAFSLVLCLYLLGIALGASWGKRLCGRPVSLPLAAAVVLAAAGALDLALPSLLTALADIPALPRSLALGTLLTLSALLKAVLFPVAHHLGSDPKGRALGGSLSRVYFMNIAGSTLGPLLTGFVLLNHVSMEGGFRLIGLACLALAAAALWFERPLRAWTVAAACVGAGWWVNPASNQLVSAYARHDTDQPVKAVISNRHGLLHTTEGGAAGDVVYGGNVYDGRTNIDLAINSNRIDRVYLLGALHPRPQRVLVIGLSTGAWVRVLSALPSVQRIDVVEINPGYLDLIRQYPTLQPLLDDPRIHIHIDDGRRWLKRHATANDARFDLIVMNTTFHWRANITNLLSWQFLNLAHDRLADGGLLAFNATGSDDALATAADVFAHAYRWTNFVYAARHDFRAEKSQPAAVARIESMRLAGRALVPVADPRYRQALSVLLEREFIAVSTAQSAAGRPLEVIDDRAMQTEFKFGKGMRFD